MADENLPENNADQGGQITPEPIVSDAVLDAMFDQVASGTAESNPTTETPESGGAEGGEDGSSASNPTGTEAAESSTPSSGSPASGEATASSAPNASDGSSPANAAPGTGKGGSSPARQPAPKAAGKQGSITPEEENRRLKGRVSALARENETLKRTQTSTPTTSSTPAPANGSPGKSGNEGGPAKSSITQKMEANPKWQTIKRDYGEIAAPLEEILGEIGVEVDKTAANREQESLNANGAIVAEAHPDAGKIVTTKEFNDWLGVQPSYVVAQVKANGNGVRDPDACIDIFNRFKADTGISFQASSQPANGGRVAPNNTQATDAVRAARRDGAIAVKTGKGGQTTNLPDDPDALFDRLAAEASKGSKAA